MITIYSKPGCKYCTYAKQLLDLHEMEYNVLELGKDFTRDFVTALFPTQTTYPIVVEMFDDGTFNLIGGYEELQSWIDG